MCRDQAIQASNGHVIERTFIRAPGSDEPRVEGLGFVGVFFVVISKLNMQDLSIIGIFCSLVALAGLSFGSLYQKKYCSNMNLFSGGAIQTFSSTILVLPFLFFVDMWTPLSFNR